MQRNFEQRTGLWPRGKGRVKLETRKTRKRLRLCCDFIASERRRLAYFDRANDKPLKKRPVFLGLLAPLKRGLVAVIEKTFPTYGGSHSSSPCWVIEKNDVL